MTEGEDHSDGCTRSSKRIGHLGLAAGAAGSFLFWGRAKAVFAARQSYSLGGAALAMVSEDFNEDGQLDLEVVGTNVSVLLADWGP